MIQIRKHGTPLKKGIYLVIGVPRYERKRPEWGFWSIGIRLPGKIEFYNVHKDEMDVGDKWFFCIPGKWEITGVNLDG